MKTSNVSSCPDGRWRKTKANNCGDVENVGGAILVNTDNIEEICNDESILGMLMKQKNQLLNVLSKIGQISTTGQSMSLTCPFFSWEQHC